MGTFFQVFLVCQPISGILYLRRSRDHLGDRLIFAMSWFLVPNQAAEGDRYTNEVDLHAVTHGEYVPLEDVPDEVFSTKMMEKAMPSSHKMAKSLHQSVAKSPLCSFKHAVGIKTQNGVEVLVHMGIDTVSLAVKALKSLSKLGSK